jgi:predicted N-formylglutamate amidohydrolase
MPSALPRPDYLILSCEHGGNRVPLPYRKLFSRRFLRTHRGYDPGALAVARDFAAATDAPFFYSTISRLFVELNRPAGHPQVFFLALPQAERESLLRRYYFPYWRGIETAIGKAVRRDRRVLHLSVHSFTPRLRGVRRTTDIGLLFDPQREREAAFCRAWKAAIEEHIPRLVVRHNDPYQGASPSVVAAMRERFSAPDYVGVQLEVNQKFPRGDPRRWLALRKRLCAALVEALSAGW